MTEPMQRLALGELESVELTIALPDPAPPRASSLPQLKCIPLWERDRLAGEGRRLGTSAIHTSAHS
ncbi:hypothetical protein PS874_04139 [Pseudomonas fluorescens]|nr:hypothetical protein PS874_04139 [Pseudomonas fluorescens]